MKEGTFMGKRIGVISLDTIGNSGDEILGTATEWLIKNVSEDVSVKHIQLFPGKTELKEKYMPELILSKLMINLLLKMPENNRTFPLWDRAIKTRIKRYYFDEFKDLDGVITAVGMLKFKTQRFSHVFDCITKTAEYYGIPVMINAASIAKPDEDDWRFGQLVEAVNCSSVRCITTRDGKNGLIKLKEYVRGNQITAAVGDPGFWVPEVYGIKKRDTVEPVIGIGLIRKDIFKSYGNGTSEKDIVSFYKGLLAELDKRNINWRLFSNGIAADYNLGLELVGNTPNEWRLIKNPENATELITTVAGFSSVFCARLHACIVSASLGLPVCGFIWEDKIKCFAENAGSNVRQCFLSEDELNPQKAAESIEKAVPLEHAYIEKIKQQAREGISAFVKSL